MRMPKHLYVLGALFLLWSLVGSVAFLTDATQNLNALAKSDAFQAELLREKPVWAWAAYGIAVVAALLGSVALLVRRKVAVPLFALSLVATLIQYAQTFLGTDVIADRGLGQAVAPAVDITIGIIEVVYSRWTRAKGRLR